MDGYLFIRQIIFVKNTFSKNVLLQNQGSHPDLYSYNLGLQKLGFKRFCYMVYLDIKN